jgi:dihydroorotate dehydrogenase electron transfer subunit
MDSLVAPIDPRENARSMKHQDRRPGSRASTTMPAVMPAPIRNVEARVLRNEHDGPHAKIMTLRVAGRFGSLPGQFLHVRCSHEHYPLLRRPFSVYTERAVGRATEIDILYTIVGIGTRELAALEPGARVTIMGPLGVTFEDNPAADELVLVAGGVGIVPFLIFSQHVRARDPRRAVRLLFGGRTREHLYGLGLFEKLAVDIDLATDDGSRGRRGTVVDLLRRRLERADRGRIQVYTCGPEAMMDRVILMTREFGVPCQASLEKRMGCALGACGACVTRVKEGDDWRYSRICIEGPVYDADRLLIGAP